ncbi:MAG: methionyl-tRNA formyltransferase [Spirochaetota bacterium]|nr:MAG: methionyl-tRNA formyltransferase [Spirochaetota bacterium]
MVKVIFFGARGVEFSGRHFTRICETAAEIVAVVDSPKGAVDSTNVQDRAQSIDKAAMRLGVPLFRPTTPRDPEFIKEISNLQPDLFISAGYWGILPPKLLEIPNIASMNFHASLLPRHCGKHPVFWTLWYGDKETGITLHHMDKGIDTGDVAYVKKVKVLPDDTVPILYNRIMNASMPIVDQLIQDATKGRVPRKPQLKKGYTYNHELTTQDLKLDYNQPAWLLEQRVRISKNRLFFKYGGKKWEVLECKAYDATSSSLKKGDIMFRADHLEFGTSRGSLEIEAVFDGKNVLKPSQIGNI